MLTHVLVFNVLPMQNNSGDEKVNTYMPRKHMVVRMLAYRITC